MKKPPFKVIVVVSLVAVAVIAIIAIAAAIALSRPQPSAVTNPSPTPTSAPAQDSADDITAQLLYTIEEEKLAYDVYTYLYDLYGARVFGTILNSESTHQNRVLTLLEDRDIDDPRSSEPGVFSNQELQQLYDQLIAQGSQSEADAFAVGVAIEEKDIADLTTILETVTDQEAAVVFESLRDASENHLRAFQAQ